MKEQKLVYLTRRQTEVGQLKESLAQNSFELSQVIGHRLKGHGETFGFPDISEIGVSMEAAAVEQNIQKLKDIVQALDLRVQENLKLIDQI